MHLKLKKGTLDASILAGKKSVNYCRCNSLKKFFLLLFFLKLNVSLIPFQKKMKHVKKVKPKLQNQVQN